MAPRNRGIIISDRSGLSLESLQNYTVFVQTPVCLRTVIKDKNSSSRNNQYVVSLIPSRPLYLCNVLHVYIYKRYL